MKHILLNRGLFKYYFYFHLSSSGPYLFFVIFEFDHFEFALEEI